MILSIVIPVFKAEKWIGRCLDSVFIQKADENEFEVVCVIDGSPDDSAGVIRKYKEKHSNIKIIEQENQGVSAARNNGIIQAGGRYITFMDSDDVFFSDSLKPLLVFLKDCREDMTVHRAFVNETEWCPWINITKDGEVLTSQEAIKRGFLHGSVWGCCYDRFFVSDNNIQFPVGVSNGEDNFFIMSCLYFADTIHFKDIKLYNVVEEDNSLSRTYTRQKVDGMIKSDSIFENYITNYPVLGNKVFVLQYIRYTRLSALVARTINTKGVGLLYLLKSGVNRQARLNIDQNIVYMRRNMVLMNVSFTMFYLMSWVKHVVFRK